jgi:hypothetical protein
VAPAAGEMVNSLAISTRWEWQLSWVRGPGQVSVRCVRVARSISQVGLPLARIPFGCQREREPRGAKSYPIDANVSIVWLVGLWRVLSTVLSLADGPAHWSDGPALRSDGPRSGQSAPVGRTVRACAEQFRVSSFVLCLLARFAELARNPVV